MTALEVLRFWFEEIEPKQRFKKDSKFDALIRDRFGSTHELAKQGLLYTWREEPLGALAEVIVLDQFSRNMFRDGREASTYGSLALIFGARSGKNKTG